MVLSVISLYVFLPYEINDVLCVIILTNFFDETVTTRTKTSIKQQFSGRYTVIPSRKKKKQGGIVVKYRVDGCSISS